MRVYLIRHGESFGNINGSLTSTTDFELTEKGKEQAVRLGNVIKNEIDGTKTVAYCSPLLRAKQTLEGVLSCMEQKEIPIIECPDLKEMDLGILECVPFSELEEKYPDVDIATGLSFLKAPGGESYAELKLRLQRFWDQCLNDLQAKDVENLLIVSHGITLRALTNQLLKRPDTDVNVLNWMENTAQTVLIYDKDSCMCAIERLNDYSHLKELKTANFEEWGLFAGANAYVK